VPRALIDDRLIQKLPVENIVFHDTKLTGFHVRCRTTRRHVYRYQVTRHYCVTIGPVAEIPVDVARALAIKAQVDHAAQLAKIRLNDLSVNYHEAKATAAVQLKAERVVGPADQTLRQFLAEGGPYEEWAAEHLKPRRGKTKAEAATARLQEVASFKLSFLDLPLTKIEDLHITRWISEKRKTGVKDGTVRRCLNTIQSIFTEAKRLKLITTHPMDEVVKPEEEEGIVRYLLPDEQKRFVQAIPHRDAEYRAARKRGNTWLRERHHPEREEHGAYADYLTPLVWTAYHTGMRQGELLQLRWKDWDRSGHRIGVRGETTKTGYSRYLPVNAALQAVLTTWADQLQAKPNGVMFPGADGKELGSPKGAFDKLMETAQIQAFRFHDLRHNFASQLVMNGIPLLNVSKLLGHKDLKTTMRYAHLAPNYLADDVAVLAPKTLVSRLVNPSRKKPADG